MKIRILLFFFVGYIAIQAEEPIQYEDKSSLSLIEEKKVNKAMKETLRYLNNLDACKPVKGSYFGLCPTEGDSKGQEVQIIIIGNGSNPCDVMLRKKESIPDTISSSSDLDWGEWEKTDMLPYNKKKHKKNKLMICPNGKVYPSVSTEKF